MECEKPDVRFRLWPRCSDRAVRIDALSPPMASAGRSAGWILGIRDVARNALLSRHNAGVLGASARRRPPRLSILERGRTAGNQGCYNDGRFPTCDGRFGQSLVAKATAHGIGLPIHVTPAFC